MNKIPTTGDVLLAYGIFEEDPEYKLITSAMIEFAKLHVKAALKDIYSKSKIKLTDDNNNYSLVDSTKVRYNSKGIHNVYPDECNVHTIYIDEDTILNAYPLTNII